MENSERIRHHFLCACLTAWLAIGLADEGLASVEVRGVVKNAGIPSDRRTSLFSPSGTNPVDLCEGGQRFVVSQLPGSIITITGIMKPIPKKTEKCLFAESVKIHEIANGRPAIIGTLKKIDKDTYAVVAGDSRTWKLSSLAPGVKALLGREVISDLVTDSASRGETRWLVVRIFAKPG
jgi:hypothetical protein